MPTPEIPAPLHWEFTVDERREHQLQEQRRDQIRVTAAEVMRTMAQPPEALRWPPLPTAAPEGAGPADAPPTARRTRGVTVPTPTVAELEPLRTGTRTTTGRTARNTRVPRPITVERLTGFELQDGHRLIASGVFREGDIEAPMDIALYADVGRTMQPYATEMMKRISEILRDVQGLPEPPRRQVPNLTVGERMYNMIEMLMEHQPIGGPVQAEWEALSMEYQRYTEGR